ncbi:hypothetical protein PC510_003809 [Escherichia coli]|uniref:hypothetical protein n=1 Tax=Escherichia coli TaxID=562 RepID=UPI000A185DB0|nr:hypothetical protein [Escherichia coli]EKI3096535.1 hypothetical protein [Escherichia coli]OSK33752.1 hypothetical protein EAHG_04992 [Escherichia coli B671]
MDISIQISKSQNVSEIIAMLTSATQPTSGRIAYVVTPRGQEVKTAFKVIEATNLIISNMLDGRINPNFPAELQPRDRTRKSSILQVNDIANHITPQRLADSGLSSHGSPIVGHDNVVESGNGRSMGILKAYAEGKADDYRQYLVDNASLYGLHSTDIEAMQNPVLVRVRLDNMDRVQFAKDSNISDLQEMAASEKAFADAESITPEIMALFAPADSGNLLAKSNDAFVTAFLNTLGDTAAAGLVTTDGRPTRQLLDRMQNAIFAKAYKNEMLVKLVAEEPDPEIRNILTALNVAAPAFVEMQYLSGEVHRQTVNELCESIDAVDGLDKKALRALVGAADLVRTAKDSGQSVDEYVQQLGLFEDVSDEVKTLALFITRNNRSSKRMGSAFKIMAEVINQELQKTGAAVNDMFGASPITLKDVLSVVDSRLEDEFGEGAGLQVGLFESVSRHPLLLESANKKVIDGVKKVIMECESVEDIISSIEFLSRDFLSCEEASKAIGKMIGEKIKMIMVSGSEKELKKLRAFSKELLGNSVKSPNYLVDLHRVRDGITESLTLDRSPTGKNTIEQMVYDGSVLLLRSKMQLFESASGEERIKLQKDISNIIFKFLKKTKLYSIFSYDQATILSYVTDGRIKTYADFDEFRRSDREKSVSQEMETDPKASMLKDQDVGQSALGGATLEADIASALSSVQTLADLPAMQSIGFMDDSSRQLFLHSLRTGQLGYGEAGKHIGLGWCYTKMDKNERADLIARISECVRPLSTRIFEVKDNLINESPISHNEAWDWASSLKIAPIFLQTEESKDLIYQQLARIYRLTRGRIFTLREIVVDKTGRAYASKNKGIIALGTRFKIRSLWHEVGHHFEYSNPTLLQKAKEFLKMKAGEQSRIVPLNKITNAPYGRSEIAIADHLYQPYAGRIYSTNGINDTRATEIFSCGLEYLYDNETGGQSVANNDLLMQFVIGAIQGLKS